MKRNAILKLALAGVLCAVAVVGSMFSFPVFGSKCAPVQHMVNILCAVLLGPWWGVGVAFVASLLRNLLGLGSLMAFPGSMCGALLCGVVFWKWKELIPTLVAEVFGTGVIGGLLAAFLFSRYRHISFAALVDLCAPSLVLGQAIGRWGNFFNQEAYGAAVENPALRFSPAAVEMESAAIGQTCHMLKTPFAILRSISDCADSEATQSFDEFTLVAAQNAIKIACECLSTL